jgi:hypothetical protein
MADLLKKETNASTTEKMADWVLTKPFHIYQESINVDTETSSLMLLKLSKQEILQTQKSQTLTKPPLPPPTVGPETLNILQVIKGRRKPRALISVGPSALSKLTKELLKPRNSLARTVKMSQTQNLSRFWVRILAVLVKKAMITMIMVVVAMNTMMMTTCTMTMMAIIMVMVTLSTAIMTMTTPIMTMKTMIMKEGASQVAEMTSIEHT